MAKKLLVVVLMVVMAFSFAGCKKMKGDFYSLKFAVEHNFITAEELEKIADYHNGDLAMDEIAPLDEKKEKAIIKTYFDGMKDHAPGAKIEGVKIVKYYGTYNDCYVVMMDNDYFKHSEDEIGEWVTINGVNIHYTTHERIVVWKQFN